MSNPIYLGYDFKILKLITQFTKILSIKNAIKVIQAHIEITSVISNDGKIPVIWPFPSVFAERSDQQPKKSCAN